MCWVSLSLYQGFVSDQGVPYAGHGLTYAQVGVKLVAVQTWHKLRQEWSQLLPGFGCNHVETKSCALKERKDSGVGKRKIYQEN